MIFALAGRRVDAADAKAARFPKANIDLVKERLDALLKKERPQALVCSAAAGSDLLALELAGELGIRREVVLPFAAPEFRKASVTDRNGTWGARFDQVVSELEPQRRVITLSSTIPSAPAMNETAYLAANQAILDRAQAIGRELHEPVCAVVVWNGASRGTDDITEAFQKAAKAAGLEVVEIPTL
jgi:hypothetical protein